MAAHGPRLDRHARRRRRCRRLVMVHRRPRACARGARMADRASGSGPQAARGRPDGCAPARGEPDHGSSAASGPGAQQRSDSAADDPAGRHSRTAACAALHDWGRDGRRCRTPSRTGPGPAPGRLPPERAGTTA
ncbi:hypothetical protein VV02_18495 [Luteipulveratus mongoliensis]|uniref:Uncharacterized protein n=1 Tax=Luteipulveratus mongoliensis TaxID=571913 RepID=A0A0K1JLC5_9MICO|nr:hypothetical protein VV02_18495 [Luteipulveratus mongoliensis]